MHGGSRGLLIRFMRMAEMCMEGLEVYSLDL